MYKIGDNVIYNHSGAYCVEAIETPAFVKESGTLYYKLSRVYANAKETVYVPAEAKDLMRPVSKKAEFDKNVSDVNGKTVVPFYARQPQLVTEHYRKSLAQNTLLSSLTVLKELYIREKECLLNGKKLRQAEGHYLALTEKAVCEEMCMCMNVALDEAKEKIKQLIEY